MAKRGKKGKQLRRDIEFLYEMGSLRNLPRSWRQTLGIDCANDLEHTLRVMWLALILARREGVKDEGKVLKMAMAHDIAETRTGDTNYIFAVYAKNDEEQAEKDIFANTSLTDFASDVLHEYRQRRTLAAKIVKDADNLDVDLEMRELEQKGSKLPQKLQKFRRLVRQKKLYTQAAKDLWDALDSVDVADWHLTANKWLKMPTAGR
ncbi:MAG: HD domain-containing protein [Patescibacteria group bacterium]